MQLLAMLLWGNFKIDEINKEGVNVVSVKATYDPLATNFSKTKKTTWIAAVPALVPCQIFEFVKLADEDKFQNFLTPVTKTEIWEMPVCAP